jgi:hypothetical protein
MDENWQINMEARLKHMDADVSSIRRDMVKATTEGVERALRNVLSDKELTKAFWQHGFDELSAHTQNNASQWIGKRILTALIIAGTTAGIIWLVKTGALK